MLGQQFYHETIRRVVVSFGTIFNDIHLVRKDNDGNVTQRYIFITDYITDFDGNVRQLDNFASPNRLNFISSTQGSPNQTLISGEIATYTATYTVQNADVASGGISNTASATSLVYNNGNPQVDAIDESDDGDDLSLIHI